MLKTTISKIACSILFLFVFSPFAQAQQKVQKQDSLLTNYLKYIDEADMKKHLSILASDEYEGRETGEKGQKMAAEYLVQQYKSFGINGINGSNNYYQIIFSL